MTTNSNLASFSFTPVLDPTHFHCIRYLGPPLKDNFDKSAPYYLFKYEEKMFVSLLTLSWNGASDSQLILPFWMKNLVDSKQENISKISFTRLANENVHEFEGTLRVEWFADGLKSCDPRFPFETVIPELLGSKRPITRNGTVVPFVFEGARYTLKFTPEDCDSEVVWFNMETGTLKFDICVVETVQPVHINQFITGLWSEEFKILKYQIENGSKDAKEAFLLCGVPLPLQEQLLNTLGVGYEQVSVSNFIPEEHLSMEEEVSLEEITKFLFIREVEKISKNLITEILRQCKHSKIILTSSSRSIESSDQLLQLEKSVRRFNFQVINCNFPAISEEQKVRIVVEECGVEESEVLRFRWALKSMNYVDLLRVCKRFRAVGDLKNAIESVKGAETESTSNSMFSSLPSQGSFNFRFFGYKKICEELKSLIKGPLMNPEAYDRFNLPKSSGFLLYGPAGCGKTALPLNILTSDPFRNLFTVLHVPSASHLLSKYFGETEANIRGLFALARERKPSIVFIDQIECLGRKRGLSDGNDGAAGDRYLSTLLNEMDGISGNEGVTIIACANDIGILDEALLRPGRLDRHFYLGLPNYEDRIDLIKGFGCESDSFEEIVRDTEGMTGAEIKSILYE